MSASRFPTSCRGAGTVAAAGLLLGTLLVPSAQAAPLPAGYTVQVLTSRTGQAFAVSGSGNPVNDSGLVAGATTQDGRRRAAVFDLRTRTIRVLDAFAGQITAAADVNRTGDVAGTIRYPDESSRAFLWSTRTNLVRTLPGPDGASSSAAALNDRGVVVGSVGNEVESRGAVWYTRTGRRQLLPLERATGVNDAGAVVGHRVDEIGEETYVRPVLWRPGGLGATTLQALPGDDSAFPSDISDTGIVVGESHSLVRDDTITRPVAWPAGRVAPCRLASGAGSGQARAVNDRGQVVGVKVGPTAARREAPAIWAGCAGPDLLLPVAGDFPVPTGINEAGQVVGGSFAGGLVWTPRR